MKPAPPVMRILRLPMRVPWWPPTVRELEVRAASAHTRQRGPGGSSVPALVHSRSARRPRQASCGQGAGNTFRYAMTERLQIAFFASSLVSSYWNGAATYYRGIVRALDARGHRITFYEPDAYGRQQHRDIEDPPWAQVVVYDAN